MKESSWTNYKYAARGLRSLGIFGCVKYMRDKANERTRAK